MQKKINENTIGGRICQLRKNNGITQEKLKEMLNIESHSTRISKIENGYTEPTCWELVEFSKIFNTTTDYILTGDIQTPPLPVVTPEEQGFILAWANKIRTFQNSN